MQTELHYDTIFDAQQHFRLLLDSMARPGKINTFSSSDILPPAGLDQAAALTGFALLNADTNYHIIGENMEDIATYLLVNTAAQQVGIDMADYIFLPENHDGHGLEEARVGTPVYPEDSATLIAAAELIGTEVIIDSLKINLQGPGVNGEAVVWVKGISPELLDYVKEQNIEYPLGIDLIITDRQNNLLCIPRSNKFTYTKTN
ncbi:phosphonate C-P lyase system protein PhnH [Mucilaginibacter celer]|uniref:Phosphonate C-P lyase system protein PhnH n=1 Tax=Mucilaginibacter celer TaxID=2305508 RepID=A0A494VSZ1_9SPHI|nr:phosphonate C-P lyase system protein PhnH [Mucilaginibacter celer]AYL94465.1 phosphonate C-P lyase system protein PhnH [Mucilaginibacter celer]